MGSIQLRLPGSLSASARQALASGYFVGLPDYMPWITQAVLEDDTLRVTKEVPESGCFCAPWRLPDGAKELPSALLRGRLPVMLATATLVEREEPYRLLVELARGKVNLLRNQAADWVSGGLEMNPELDEAIRAASRGFARAVCQPSGEEADSAAEEALLLALATGEDLVAEYVAQVMSARTARMPKLTTLLGCTVPRPLADAGELKASFNTLRLPFNWAEIEATEGTYQWQHIDEWLEWARPLGMTLEAGPLFEMSPSRLPSWLPDKLGDPQGVANLMVDFLEAALERYRESFKFWQITSGLNDPALLELDEEESLWLNTQLYAAAQQIHPTGEFSLALSQPWGESVAKGSPAYSPFVYADALLRSRVMLSALDLELILGVTPRSSMPRDRLDTSRLFDLYALLGIPLKITLGHPGNSGSDPHADPLYALDPECGPECWTPQTQADWTELISQLVVCKPYINALTLANYSDEQPHLFPHLGLVDATGQPRPALAKLRELRERYLF